MTQKKLKCLIVGAGSSGIAAAKESLNVGLEPSVYEARGGPGGAWRFDKDPGTCQLRFSEDGWAIFSNQGESDFARPPPPSPMYDRLKTNVPSSLMQYRGRPFPPDVSLFCSHEQVQAYLEDSARPLNSYISYNRRVNRIRYTRAADGGEQRKWFAEIASALDDSDSFTAQFDFIIVANGHYSKPFVPWIDGLKSFQGELSHARWYRSPETYENKTVLVVGNSASGYDITREIAMSIHERRTALPNQATIPLPRIYQSARSPSALGIAFDAPDAPSWAKEIKVFPPIQKIAGRTIVFEDGQTLDDVDVIQFATGYTFSFPFLHSSDAPWSDHPVTRPPITPVVSTEPDSTLGSAIPRTRPSIDGGLRLHNLDDRFLFYLPDPTAVFLCLPYLVIPFPLAQIQARLSCLHFVDSPQLPKPLTFSQGVPEDEAETRESVIFGHPKQFDLMDRLMEESGDVALNDSGGAGHKEYGRTSQADRDLRVGAKALRRAVLGY
ncbi:uncharacterized protein JCM6883_004894 [Sporobolomyces salmoneus]|uniref:uncharacterized protein n=1 Tax=Sporobolomyces salmoneus TaxID=183962 RepID=UPI00317FCBE6